MSASGLTAKADYERRRLFKECNNLFQEAYQKLLTKSLPEIASRGEYSYRVSQWDLVPPHCWYFEEHFKNEVCKLVRVEGLTASMYGNSVTMEWKSGSNVDKDLFTNEKRKDLP